MITDRDAFIASPYPRSKAGRVKTMMPCGATVVAEQSEIHPTYWFITMFKGEREIGRLGLQVTPSNANAVFKMLREMVHHTPGIEEKT